MIKNIVMYNKKIIFFLVILLTFPFSAAYAAEWTEIGGTVSSEDGIPLCAMVLANGQYLFSCEPVGEYSLSVPPDENGQITLFAFCDGFAPFKETLSPVQAVNYDIAMSPASPESGEMTITTEFDIAVTNPGWMTISGSVCNDEDTPLCAMVLANGQHMFTCGDSQGTYSIEVPADSEGNVTVFGFCDGFQPFKYIFDVTQIDVDGDGYTEEEGDCNGYDVSIYIGAPETCNDGIDQDCDGMDATQCPVTSITEGDWDGKTKEDITLGDSRNEVDLGFVVSDGNITRLSFLSSGMMSFKTGFYEITDNQFTITETNPPLSIKGEFRTSSSCFIEFKLGSYTSKLFAYPESK